MTRKAKSHLLPNSEEYYQVDQIIDKRLTSNGMMYLIKWVGYPESKDYTWEPVQHLTEVERLVKEFNQRTAKPTKSKDPIKLSAKLASKLKKHDEEEEPPEEVVDLQEGEEVEVEVKPSRKRQRIKIRGVKKDKSGSESQQQQVEERKPRRINPRKPQLQKGEEVIDKPWEREGMQLGRIHKYFVVEGDLLFNVNLEKEGMVWGSIYLSYGTLVKLERDRLIEFMENQIKYRIMEKRERKSEFGREFAKFWGCPPEQQ